MVHELITLTGVIQTPGGEDGDRDGGFAYVPFLTAVNPFLGDVDKMRHCELTAVRWTRLPL